MKIRSAKAARAFALLSGLALSLCAASFPAEAETSDFRLVGHRERGFIAGLFPVYRKRHTHRHGRGKWRHCDKYHRVFHHQHLRQSLHDRGHRLELREWGRSNLSDRHDIYEPIGLHQCGQPRYQRLGFCYNGRNNSDLQLRYAQLVAD